MLGPDGTHAARAHRGADRVSGGPHERITPQSTERRMPTTRNDVLESLQARLAGIDSMDEAALEQEHVHVLGRKAGLLTAALKSISQLPIDERRTFGADLNRLRQQFESAFDARRLALAQATRSQEDDVDPTMPGRASWSGGIHPVNRVIDEIVEIFRRLGFAVAVGPEAETEWLNFGALNFPPDHPAMDMHDTLYLDVGGSPAEGQGMLLRTHTSPVQIRTLQASPPPVRVVIPGTCYRKDTFDASHAPAFSQIEGLAVDEGITFVDLKATLIHFAHEFFSPDTKVRFRPSFFPFTEPSAEMDIGCLLCGGSGCRACKGSGWMEILGCGMVHPNVLKNCDVDPERYTGFAFGMGPHRIAMLRYGIPDIRMLFEGDMRFLSQFGE